MNPGDNQINTGDSKKMGEGQREILKNRADEITETSISIIRWVMVGGFVPIVLYGVYQLDLSKLFLIIGIGLIVALASALVGAIIGFIFGIPRSPNTVSDFAASGDSTQIPNEETLMDRAFQSNTNLEQISDWLTKILVGVGLTQITVFPEKLKSLSEYIGKAFVSVSSSNPHAGSTILAGGIVLFYSMCGFLISYLWSRVYLPGAFSAALIKSLRAEIKEKEVRLVSFEEKQRQKDLHARELVEKQLAGHSVDPDTLMNSINEASSEERDKIINKTSEVRRKNWKDNKPVMERTLPIYKALAESPEEDNRFYYHGEYGFALKDKREPDYKKALEELSRAIHIRGSWREYGWLEYEFCRAICYIKLTEQGECKDEEAWKHYIIEDLRIAKNSNKIKHWIEENIDIQNWKLKQGIAEI